MVFQKAIMSPNEEKMAEYRNAQISNQQSLIEYIAVMSDIDLPTEDTENTSMGPDDSMGDLDEMED